MKFTTLHNIMKLTLFIFISLVVLNPVIIQAQNNSDKPEQIAFIYGEDSFPSRMLGEKCSIGGDRDLIDKLEKVEFKITNEITVKEVFLKELAVVLNKQFFANSGWKIVVDKNAQKIMVSGMISNSAIDSLVSLMKTAKFHCKITDGIITLKKGGNSMGATDK